MYICICEQVTDREIKQAIDDGANTLRKLSNELGIIKQCGQCGKCTKKILNEQKQLNIAPCSIAFSNAIPI